jgi:hypothetical protein
MKTSLVIEDRIFEEAKKEADRTGSTISEVISTWARLGRDIWKEGEKRKAIQFKAADLGEALLDISNRKHWMDDLDE